MSINKLPFYVLLLFAIAFFDVNSQTLDNIKAEVQNEKVQITFDLTTNNPDHKFGVQLFSSDNNYRSPLTLVSGDIGEEVQPGKSKKIIWDAASELNRFSGNITFEIRATLISANIDFQNPEKGTLFRRGRTYQIDWGGGKNNPDFAVELYRNNVKLESIGRSKGKKNYTWTIPLDRKPGDYKIKLVDGATPVAQSSEFRIGRKIPLVLKIAPFIVIGAVVGVLSTAGGESTPPEDNSLPNPPSTPDN